MSINNAIRTAFALALTLALGGCAQKSPGPQTVRETGYLGCVAAAGCAGALCTAAAGGDTCEPLPAACDNGATCACAGETLCGTAVCRDVAGGVSCVAGAHDAAVDAHDAAVDAQRAWPEEPGPMGGFAKRTCSEEGHYAVRLHVSTVDVACDDDADAPRLVLDLYHTGVSVLPIAPGTTWVLGRDVEFTGALCPGGGPCIPIVGGTVTFDSADLASPNDIPRAMPTTWGSYTLKLQDGTELQQGFAIDLCAPEPAECPLETGTACPAEAATLAGPLGIAGTVLAAVHDNRGPVVFWGSEYELWYEEQSGIFAARPGQPVVRLLPNINVGMLAVAEVPDGFLVCFTTASGSPLPDAGCFSVDAELRAPGASTSAQNGGPAAYISQMVRIDGALYAVQRGTLSMLLTALDNTGQPLSEVNLDCGGPFALGGPPGAQRVVCLKSSDPNCGSQFDEPANCTYTIRAYAADGRLLSNWPGLVPFGDYMNRHTVYLAAGADGVLVAWTRDDADRDGAQGRRTTHLLAVDGLGADATPAAPVTLPMALSAVAATASGYLVLGGMGLPGDDVYSDWPVVAQVDTAGRLTLDAPRWLVTPSVSETERSRDTAVALDTDGETPLVAWIGDLRQAQGQGEPQYQIHTRTLPAQLDGLVPMSNPANLPELPPPPECPVFAPVPAPPPEPPPPPLPCHPVNGVCPEGCPVARGAPIDPTHGCIQFADAHALGCYAAAPADGGLSCQTIVESGEIYVFDQNAVVAGPDGTTFRACTGREKASAQHDCSVSSHAECAPPIGTSCLTSEDCGVQQMCFDPLSPEQGRCLCQPGALACGDCCCAP